VGLAGVIECPAEIEHQAPAGFCHWLDEFPLPVIPHLDPQQPVVAVVPVDLGVTGYLSPGSIHGRGEQGPFAAIKPIAGEPAGHLPIR